MFLSACIFTPQTAEVENHLAALGSFADGHSQPW